MAVTDSSTFWSGKTMASVASIVLRPEAVPEPDCGCRRSAACMWLFQHAAPNALKSESSLQVNNSHHRLVTSLMLHVHRQAKERAMSTMRSASQLVIALLLSTPGVSAQAVAKICVALLISASPIAVGAPRGIATPSAVSPCTARTDSASWGEVPRTSRGTATCVRRRAC